MGRTLELVARLTMAGLIAAALFVLPRACHWIGRCAVTRMPVGHQPATPQAGQLDVLRTPHPDVPSLCPAALHGWMWRDHRLCDRAPLAGQHDRQLRGAGDRSPQRQHLGLRATEPRTLQRLREPEVVPVPPGPLGDRHGAFLRPGGTNMSVLRPPARPWLLEEGCDRRLQRRPRRHVDRAGRSGDRHRHGGGQGSRARTARPALLIFVGVLLLAAHWFPRRGRRVEPRLAPGGVEASSLTRSFLPPLFGDDWCILGGHLAALGLHDARFRRPVAPVDGTGHAPAVAGIDPSAGPKETRSTSAGEVVLETDRLLLRRWRVSDAAFQRQLWTERDPRVPPHRRIGGDGHPTLEDIEGWIRSGDPDPSLGLLVAERRGSADAVGYCGPQSRTSTDRRASRSWPTSSSDRVAAVHEQHIGLLDLGSQTVRATLGSAVSSSTPTDFQPSSAIGVSGSSPAMTSARAASRPRADSSLWS